MRCYSTLLQQSGMQARDAIGVAIVRIAPPMHSRAQVFAQGRERHDDSPITNSTIIAMVMMVMTSSVIFTHDQGAVPLHLPVTPLTR